MKLSVDTFPAHLSFTAVDLEHHHATIDISLATPDAATGFDADEDAITSFAVAASWGLAPARGLGAAPPLVTLRPAQVTPLRLHQSLVAEGLHPGAYRILLNILAQMHYNLRPLDTVQVHGAGSGRALSFEEVMAAGFPDRPSQLPFELLVADEVGKELVCRVTFQQPVAERIYAAVTQRFGAWDSVVILGGYAVTFEEAELQIVPRTTAVRFADTIEHTILNVGLSPAAIDGLILMLCQLHDALGAIRAVEIE